MAFTVTPPPLGQQGFGQPVEFVVQSTGTWDELNTTVSRLMAKMAAENPRLTNPDTDLKLNKPQLKIEVDLAVVQHMSFYNFAAAMVLVYAGTHLELRSALLWPVIVLHLGLGAWCVVTLWFARRKTSRSEMT